MKKSHATLIRGVSPALCHLPEVRLIQQLQHQLKNALGAQLMAGHELHIGRTDLLVVAVVDGDARVNRAALAGRGCCVLMRVGHPWMISGPVLHEASPGGWKQPWP